MEIKVQLTNEPIAERILCPLSGSAGAWAEFRGVVRGEENKASISALEYEAYAGMAEKEIRRLLEEIPTRHLCLAAIVIHRVGVVPVGEAAIYVGIAAKHRGPAFASLAEFMDRLKQDVPIWKRRAIVTAFYDHRREASVGKADNHGPPLQLNAALEEINARVQPLTGVRVLLGDATGRVLREDVVATEDSPSCDRSTRDGYAILQDDGSEVFTVVDVLHAADWKPRQLKNGEAVRVATGAALPCEHLRVVMQENIERTGDTIKVLRRENTSNVRWRGTEMRASDIVLSAGKKLDAGALALLASIGCVKPLVSPRLRVAHFTTGDEIIPPEQTPKPGQVRDSNSALIDGLLQTFQCDLRQAHLPEDFELAKQEIEKNRPAGANVDVVLVSGGASVGDKDFTRPLLEWLGFEIVFGRLNLRPGAPLIFGTNGKRVAFGLPGNPLSHFICFHLFVTAALERLTGCRLQTFQRGTLSEKLEDAPNPRETLWAAKMEWQNGRCELSPLKWSSSGDVAVLAETNALIRIPASCGSIAAGAEVEFLATKF